MTTIVTTQSNITQPNILFFIVDEQRYPTVYETPELKQWKKDNLKFQTLLSENGSVFHNHYTNTVACPPARGTIHTGQFPSVHGVTQTDGIAISATDPQMTWMNKFTVPTIGNYLEEIGYISILKGKWHVSDANLYTNSGSVIYTFDNNGIPIPELEQFYLDKDILSDYGYHGFIGPEPHGNLPINSGSSVPPPQRGRDIGYTNQLINELDKLNNCEKPWFLNASFVNPHDISEFAIFTIAPEQRDNWYFPVDPTLPANLFTPEFETSHFESLRTKPAAQTYYRNLFNKIIQPIPRGALDRYYRVYYTLQKTVDNNMYKVWKKLKSLDAYKNTIVLFTSDHGELLGSHGNMHEKWYSAYQESIHVPLIISSPLFGNNHRDIYSLTSHIDIAPTILGFAGLKSEKQLDRIRHKLNKRFSLALPLPGKDLSKYTIENRKLHSKPIYFFTEDQPDNGPNQVNVACIPYQHVPQPCNLDAVIIKINDELYKFTRYYDKNGRCNHDCKDKNGRCDHDCKGKKSNTNNNNISEQIKTHRNNEGIPGELYNITEDPIEINNLLFDDQYKHLVGMLNELLMDLSFLYRGDRGVPVMISNNNHNRFQS